MRQEQTNARQIDHATMLLLFKRSATFKAGLREKPEFGRFKLAKSAVEHLCYNILHSDLKLSASALLEQIEATYDAWFDFNAKMQYCERQLEYARIQLNALEAPDSSPGNCSQQKAAVEEDINTYQDAINELNKAQPDWALETDRYLRYAAFALRMAYAGREKELDSIPASIKGLAQKRGNKEHSGSGEPCPNTQRDPEDMLFSLVT